MGESDDTTTRKKGLRFRLKPPSPKKPVKKSNAEKCREHRSAIKADPERYTMECLNNQARNRQNQQRPLTEEEKTRRKELNKLRHQECRARKKAAQLELAKQTPASAKAPLAGKCNTRSKTKEEEGALQMQRQKWAESKRNQRQNWTAQKRRRDREKALQRYYQRKATVQTAACKSASPPSTGCLPVTPPSAGRSALPSNTSSTPNGAPASPVGAAKKSSKHGNKQHLHRMMKAVFKRSPDYFRQLMKKMTKLGKSTPRKRRILQDLEEGSPSSKNIKQRVFFANSRTWESNEFIGTEVLRAQ